MNSFPYPVLSYLDSDYKENCSFSLNFDKSELSDNDVMLFYQLSLESEYLVSLLSNGYAKVIIKIKSDIFSGSFPADINGNHTVISINSENFKQNDIISATAFVIASKPFEMKWNSDLIPIYDNSLLVQLRKNDILAESNKENLNYNMRNNDFIRFVPSDEQNGKGVKISLSDPNYINIIIGTKMNAAYIRKRNDKSVSSIFASHIIFEAFLYVICEVLENSEEYSTVDWYKLLNQLFLSTGESIEEFKERAYSNKPDISQIFEKAQELVNNSIEMSLINIAKEEGV